MNLRKDMSKLTEKQNKKIIQSVVSQLPLSEVILSSTNAYLQKRRLKRLAIFLTSSELDTEYLEKLFHDEGTGDLFLEYVESVIATQNNCIAAILGIIYADNNLPKSIKSVAAHSLKGLSLASMHLFENICIEVKKNQDAAEMPFQSDSKVNLVENKYGFSKLELQTYKQDLISRNLIEQYGESNDISNYIQTTEYSMAISKRLIKAKEIIEPHKKGTGSY